MAWYYLNPCLDREEARFIEPGFFTRGSVSLARAGDRSDRCHDALRVDGDDIGLPSLHDGAADVDGAVDPAVVDDVQVLDRPGHAVAERIPAAADEEPVDVDRGVAWLWG